MFVLKFIHFFQKRLITVLKINQKHSQTPHKRQKSWFKISQTNFKPAQIKFIYLLLDALLGIVRRRELNQRRSLT